MPYIIVDPKRINFIGRFYELSQTNLTQSKTTEINRTQYSLITKRHLTISHIGPKKGTIRKSKKGQANYSTHRETNEFPIFHVKHNSANTNSMLYKSNPKNKFKAEIKHTADEQLLNTGDIISKMFTDIRQKLVKSVYKKENPKLSFRVFHIKG